MFTLYLLIISIHACAKVKHLLKQDHVEVRSLMRVVKLVFNFWQWFLVWYSVILTSNKHISRFRFSCTLFWSYFDLVHLNLYMTCVVATTWHNVLNVTRYYSNRAFLNLGAHYSGVIRGFVIQFCTHMHTREMQTDRMKQGLCDPPSPHFHPSPTISDWLSAWISECVTTFLASVQPVKRLTALEKPNIKRCWIIFLLECPSYTR